MENEQEKQDGLYRQLSIEVDKWLPIHVGETFTLDLICNQLEARSREARQAVAIKLYNEIRKEKLEKINRTYRFVDNSIKAVDWLNANEKDLLDIKYPCAKDPHDHSCFGFDGHITVNPGDIHVVAGMSNMGKTTYAHNFLYENMDNYPCVLFMNEASPVKLKRRLSRMTWANPLKDDGIPKFDVIERHDNWKDVIRPDHINIIDWINLEDNFYRIGSIIEGIQSKIKSGMALILLQKNGDKTLGTGGGFSLHLASLYLAMDYNRMTVVKCKEWNGHNPNNEMYAFQIVEGGTQFHDIHRVKKCPKCYKFTNPKCELCNGTGYIKAEDR